MFITALRRVGNLLLEWCIALRRLIEPCDPYRSFVLVTGESLFYDLQQKVYTAAHQ